MLKSYHFKIIKLLKSHPNIPKKHLEDYLDASKVLFDICSCKYLETNKCNYPKEKKVPYNEQTFLMDQRSLRKMIMGNTDAVTTRKNQKSLKRKLKH